MRKTIVLPLLTILAAAVLLLGLSWCLGDLSIANARQAHLDALHTLLPGSTDFTLEPYTGEDANIRSVHKGDNGFVIETAVQGYAGEIRMMVGVKNDGKVVGLVVQDLSETYGLGAEALTDDVFLAQFLNSAGTFEVTTASADAFSSATGETVATGDETVQVDALTGATVTSKAIVRAINSAVAYVTGADASSSATTWGG